MSTPEFTTLISNFSNFIFLKGGAYNQLLKLLFLDYIFLNVLEYNI